MIEWHDKQVLFLTTPYILYFTHNNDKRTMSKKVSEDSKFMMNFETPRHGSIVELCIVKLLTSNYNLP